MLIDVSTGSYSPAKIYIYFLMVVCDCRKVLEKPNANNVWLVT